MGLSVHSLGDGLLTSGRGRRVPVCRLLEHSRPARSDPGSRTTPPHAGAIAGNRGRSGEVNLARNSVLVIDQPTEFDRDTAHALVAVAEDGQTVIYRHTPVDHTIRIPARFRLMVTTRPDELDTRRHRATSALERCAFTGPGPPPCGCTMSRSRAWPPPV